MNILIIYSTKYGYTKKCVDYMKANLEGNVDVCNVKDNKVKDLSNYDWIIIGGSIYIGRTKSALRKFCIKYLDILKTKKIGLFITCLLENEEALNQIINSFPKELYDHAIAIDYFGGEIIYKKLRLFDKLITNMVSKSKQLNFPKLDENKNITQFKKEHIENFCRKIINSK